MGVATDASGVYVTGWCGAALTYSNVGGVMTGAYNASTDGFIIRYNSNGTFAWGRYITGAGAVVDQVWGVATDASGVYVTGYCNASLTSASIGGYMIGDYTGNWDGFIIKYDPYGAFSWGRYINSPVSTDQTLGVATDDSGVYVTGFCGAALSLDNIGGVMTGFFRGGSDGFIIKYSSIGAFVWGRYISGTGSVSDQGLGIAANASGVYVTGYCGAALSLDNIGATGSLGMTGAYVGGADGFIIKYNSNGAFDWGRYIGGTAAVTDRTIGVAADASSVYVTGFCSAALVSDSIGGGMTGAYTGGQDGFIIRYSSNGDFDWGRYLNSTGALTDSAPGVAADASGVYVTGFCAAALVSANIGGGMTGTFAGNSDGFIIKYV
jgi:hypothetical protein